MLKFQPQRVYSESAYILHMRRYRESSLLLDVFAQHHGRLSLIAKGFARPTRQKNPLAIFTKYALSWISQQSELYLLTQAEELKGAYLFPHYPLCCGFYLNEILLRVLQKEDPHPMLFEDYENVLKQMYENTHGHIEISLRLFENKLLQNLGYGFCFDELQPDKYYHYQDAKGLTPVISKMEEGILGENLLALRDNQLKIEHLPKIKKLMRQALHSLLGDKPIKSRELF